MPIWAIFALVWPCAPHSGLSATIPAHSDGIHSNSVTQSGSRWPREYRVSASGIRRERPAHLFGRHRRPAWRACRPLSRGCARNAPSKGSLQYRQSGLGQCLHSLACSSNVRSAAIMVRPSSHRKVSYPSKLSHYDVIDRQHADSRFSFHHAYHSGRLSPRNGRRLRATAV